MPLLTLSCLEGVRHQPWGFLPITQGGRKIIQTDLVTFWKYIEICFEVKFWEWIPCCCHGNTFLEKRLRKIRALQNSNDINVTSFLD